MDYAQARDDLYEWECRQRALQREQRHRERMEQERMRPPSPPPVVHYTDHEAVTISEKIKGQDTFHFHVELFVKYKLLKKVRGTHTTLYEIILWWLNAIDINTEGSVYGVPQPFIATDTARVDYVNTVFKLSWSIL